MYNYNKLFCLLEDKGLKPSDLCSYGVPNHTITRLKRNENVSLKTLNKICTILDCTIDDIVSVSVDQDSDMFRAVYIKRKKE